MLPTPSTLTRAWVVAMPAGIVTPWLPSFGVLARSSIGKALPPSTDSVMRTLAVLIGTAVVPATLQVTVCAEPAAQLTAVFGAVTAKGQAALLTVIAVAASLVPPPPALLSRTVTLKFKVRLAFGSTSPANHSGVVVPGNGAVAGTAFALLRMYRQLWKVRVGSAMGSNERNIGPLVTVASSTPTAFAGPRSNYSHSYVSTSPPSASLPLALSVNGVRPGMLNAAGVLTVGIWFPVELVMPHVEPMSVVMYLRISS